MKVQKIIIHHSLSDDQRGSNWEAVRRWHAETNGWADIGYHFGTEKIGSIYMNRKGRAENIQGAHTLQKGMNTKSLGWCFVGNFDRDVPEKAMLLTAAPALAMLLLRYGLTINDMEPHSKYADKSCPGTKFPMDSLKYWVSTNLALIGEST